MKHKLSTFQDVIQPTGSCCNFDLEFKFEPVFRGLTETTLLTKTKEARIQKKKTYAVTDAQ